MLITEQQQERDFVIEVDPAAQPLVQTLYVAARVEVNSEEQNVQTSAPITLRILPSGVIPTGSTATSSAASANHTPKQ